MDVFDIFEQANREEENRTEIMDHFVNEFDFSRLFPYHIYTISTGTLNQL